MSLALWGRVRQLDLSPLGAANVEAKEVVDRVEHVASEKEHRAVEGCERSRVAMPGRRPAAVGGELDPAGQRGGKHRRKQHGGAHPPFFPPSLPPARACAEPAGEGRGRRRATGGAASLPRAATPHRTAPLPSLSHPHLGILTADTFLLLLLYYPTSENQSHGCGVTSKVFTSSQFSIDIDTP
eukprot:scaffold166812_cov32-Tisochrysis_lutea.AAC.4